MKVQVVESPGLGVLQAQTLVLNNIDSVTYPLTTKQTPDCKYSSSGWSVSQTKLAGISTRNSDYNSIVANTGVYSVPSDNHANRAGYFQITIETVTVNGVEYTPTSLLSPFSFTLTASTGCEQTVVTASSV